MTQEDKDLLFKDICGRLPYGVKLGHESFKDVIILHAIDATQYAVDISIDNNTSFWNSIEQVKPYLFPLSSMTEEQYKEYTDMGYSVTERWWSTANYHQIEWFNKNHFDYRGLIPKELAIDCTNLNIY